MFPDWQSAADLFAGQWVSAVPGLRTGQVALFDDRRIAWLAARLPLSGLKVLELGALEGGHTWSLARAGAVVHSIEGQPTAFLRALLAAAYLGIEARFTPGDFREYLRTSSDRYDLVLASGVLYHQPDPPQLVRGIARVTDRVFIWTHYDEGPGERVELGRWHGYRHRYGPREPDYCGGLEDSSVWMPREQILDLLAHNGFRTEVVADTATSNGPALTVYGERAQ
jgi:SAM-dependent methyltransferase